MEACFDDPKQGFVPDNMPIPSVIGIYTPSVCRHAAYISKNQHCEHTGGE